MHRQQVNMTQLGNHIQPTITTSPERKLVGKKLTMSFANNKTGELWKSFMPRRHEIKNNLTAELISMQLYSPTHFSDFNLTNEFDKSATVEVSDFDNVPHGMETFVLPDGLYAVFYHKGLSSDNSIFQYIFGTWLPASDYVQDNRPHFEILGAKYKNNDPNSEEEIWIPIRKK